MSEKPKRGKGQPTKYKPEYNEIAYKLCSKHGYADKELADMLGIAVSTLNGWKDAHPNFLESIKRGKDEFDTEVVERAMYKGATGFMRQKQVLDKDGNIVTLLEEVPPNPTLCVYWTKNRGSTRWKDKLDHEHSGNVSVICDFGFGNDDESTD